VDKSNGDITMSEDIKEVQAIQVGGAGKTVPLKPIKPKHALFIKHYINTHNGSEACRLAGYTNKQPHNTANSLLKRPEIVNEIKRQEEELHKALTKDRPTFLLELRDLKARCREKGKLDAEIKLATLEASILGLTQPEQQQQINVFSSIDRAERFLNGFKDTNDTKTGQDIAKAEIVEPSGQGAQVNTIDTAPAQMSALPVDNAYTTDSAQTISLDIPNSEGGGG